MLESLIVILDIQEFDIKMIRLMRVRTERQKELDNIDELRKDLQGQLAAKEAEELERKKNIKVCEREIAEINTRVEKLEGQQHSIKKVDEFNALSQEITAAERERTSREQHLADLNEQLGAEDQVLSVLKENLKSLNESSSALEKEIEQSITQINKEGSELKKERDKIAREASESVLHIYERLLSNKKDRVIVPIENRTCSGCHIVLTAQHENLVRKGERLVFCEHCSRIHYWPESKAVEDTSAATTKRRRRRSTTTAAII